LRWRKTKANFENGRPGKKRRGTHNVKERGKRRKTAAAILNGNSKKVKQLVTRKRKDLLKGTEETRKEHSKLLGSRSPS